MAQQAELFGVTIQRHAGGNVRVTNLERPLVDVLVRPDLGGGWGEVWRSLESVEYFDLEQVADYTLKLRSATAVAKVGDLLHRLGLSSQKPMRRAYERDDAEIKKWKEETYPEIKKSAKKQGAEIFWLDEASIRSDDPLMRTWGLKGQTPTVKTSGQRQGVNAISALSNSGGFWCRVYTERFNADVCIECLEDLVSNRKKPLYVITDGHPVHKSKKVKEYVASLKGRLSIFILPPYAPDLNPDKLVWNYIRQTGTARSPLKKANHCGKGHSSTWS